MFFESFEVFYVKYFMVELWSSSGLFFSVVYCCIEIFLFWIELIDMADLVKLVDVLKKSELAFEVLVRGGAVDTVAKMRISLRILLSEGVEPNLSQISLENFGEYLVAAKHSLGVLFDDCENLEPVKGDKFQKIIHRASVFENRVTLLRQALSALSNNPDSDTLKTLEELKNRFQCCQDILGSLSGGFVSAPQNPSNVPSPSIILSSQVVKTPLRKFSAPNEELRAAVVEEGESSAGVNFHAEPLYRKLSHPAERLISTLPRTDGCNLELLIRFFCVALEIVRLYPDISSRILSVLTPYAFGPLSSCLSRHSSFAEFHKEAINLFVPTKRLLSLTQDLFYRPQGHTENIFTYITHIREAAQVLLLNKSEAEVVGVIVEGLSPEIRSCAVFADRPRSFSDLDRLGAYVNNIQFSDGQRNTVTQSLGAGVGGVRPRPVVSCFRCGRLGHMSRECRAGLSRQYYSSKNSAGQGN